MAREHNAVPVLVTAPARTAFNEDGTIKDGPGLHGGDNFCYIRAMKQIGEETHTPVIDLFSYTVKLFESIGEADIHKYTSIKKGINKAGGQRILSMNLLRKKLYQRIHILINMVRGL